ncbi:MAG TPA: NAD(P)-binding domain-containing protein [Acidimicrobiia bacterium]|nr:NAD(P)-binding domain-containing protein [Acidimicrobiia bacterium]HZQ79598.1 NAD(P)-binding domain-containing protein [Acidimicrobiia bacterium]
MPAGTGSDAAYDLVVVGGNSGGLSVAIAAQSGGLGRVRILEPSSAVAYTDLIGEHQLDVGFGETVESIDVAPGDKLEITTTKGVYRARSCVVAHRTNVGNSVWTPPIDAALSERVIVDRFSGQLVDQDILIVGHSDHAVEMASKAAMNGARVVLAAGGMIPKRLSPIGQRMLRRLERERMATILFRSVPQRITEDDGLPLACFGDRRTPDLEFDKVVFASGRTPVKPDDVGLTEAAAASGRVWLLGLPTSDEDGAPVLTAAAVLPEVARLFPTLEAYLEAEAEAARRDGGRSFAVIEELRKEHYNATIIYFEPTHSDLWVLGVKPDHGDVGHLPGQYASLGLGFWEDRIDEAEDPGLEERWDKLVRRSYSISHRIFDEYGYLAQERDTTELEFYIVLVPPTPENIPGLTPRLALKRPGDRIYLGPKVAGRYTLGPVTDPRGTVVFFATGTGEAPHNAMIVELLRKGHMGPIVSAVTVRNLADLGYIDKHRELESRYANFHYLPLPTREPGIPKRYIQDLITDDVFEKEYGVTLDPATTHVFMCGNPAMIGLPKEDEETGALTYPKPTGVVEILTERGFTLDHRNKRGNLHFEEYW